MTNKLITNHDFFDTYSNSSDNLIISCPHAHTGEFIDNTNVRIIKTIAYLPDNFRQFGDRQTHELFEDCGALGFGHGIRSTLSTKSVNLNKNNVFIKGKVGEQKLADIKNLAINLPSIEREEIKDELRKKFNIEDGRLDLFNLDEVDFKELVLTDIGLHDAAICQAVKFFYEYHSSFVKNILDQNKDSLVLELHSCALSSEQAHGGGLIIGTNRGNSIENVEKEVFLAKKLSEKGYDITLTDLDHSRGIRDEISKSFNNCEIEKFEPQNARFFGPDVLANKRKFIENITNKGSNIFQIEIPPRYRENELVRKKLAEDLVTISDDIL